MRGRVIPVNPNTERQGEARANLAQVVGAWSNTLSQAQRDAWSSYALTTPVTDRLGAQITLSGQQMFLRSMLPRLIAGLALVPDGPITAGLATTPVFTVDPAIEEPGLLTATVLVEGAGVTGDLSVYMSQPLPLSRSPAHAKRAWAGLDQPPVAGSFSVSIATGNLPWTPTPQLQTRVTVVYLADDGRVSAEAFRDVVITAAA